jgi:two-component system, NtrC family, response regulator AtoC
MKPRVLFIDDERDMCEVAELGLGQRGYEVVSQTAGDEALALIAHEDFDVVVTDLIMPRMSGLDLCTRIVASRPDTPVIVATAFGSLESAIAAIRAGAYDFVTKPFDFEVLRLALDRAVQHRTLRSEVTRLRAVVSDTRRFEGLLGQSVAMKKVYDLVERIAETDASVLITGESGTGKELVARAVHGRSPRKGGPFVAMNCAAVPENLLESELFGHARGAFTDAKTSRAGLFVEASGGVIFLDEIGELPMPLQPKLLRALQEKRVRPVGGSGEVPFDARIVAATNRDLELMVEEQRFREDLFYRINVIHVAMPPLRTRENDILLIAQHFVDHYARTFKKNVTTISPPAAERLLGYPWPGNVRELQNCIERAVALTRMSEIVVEDLPEKMQGWKARELPGRTAAEPDGLLTLDEMERRHILRAMELHGGNRGLAAEALGIDRKTLYRKLRSYGHGKDDGSAAG